MRSAPAGLRMRLLCCLLGLLLFKEGLCIPLGIGKRNAHRPGRSTVVPRIGALLCHPIREYPVPSGK